MDKQTIWNVRTDLAYDEVIRNQDASLQGLVTEELTINDFKVIKHNITEAASQKLNKPQGTYYTLDLAKIDYHDATICEKIENTLAIILNDLLNKMELKNKACLLVGLGNINVTPDALGPYTMDNVIVTKHLADNGTLSEGFSSVSAISPGVMGTTGLETFTIVKSIVREANVDFVIVVDALASNSIERVNKTIQITDTGISPGSGVGNRRKELSVKTVGIPVIAIGVPTVVDAVTITSEVIDYVVKYLSNAKIADGGKLSPSGVSVSKEMKEATPEQKEVFFGSVGTLTFDEKKNLIQTVLTPTGYNLMVTPKEIDENIEDLAKIIATGINYHFMMDYYKVVLNKI